MAVEVTSLVWQLVEAKAYKVCQVVGLKKVLESAIVCVFYKKRRLKKLFPSPNECRFWLKVSSVDVLRVSSIIMTLSGLVRFLTILFLSTRCSLLRVFEFKKLLLSWVIPAICDFILFFTLKCFPWKDVPVYGINRSVIVLLVIISVYWEISHATTKWWWVSSFQNIFLRSSCLNRKGMNLPSWTSVRV